MPKIAGVIAFVIGMTISVVAITRGIKIDEYVMVACGFATLIAFLVMILVIEGLGDKQ